MTETLETCIQRRAKALGITSAEMCRRAKLSRQTLHSLTQNKDKLPNLQTIVSLARVLHLHPMRLLQLVFDAHPSAAITHMYDPGRKGDQSAFIRDVTFADGDLVLPGQRFTKIWELQNVGSVPWVERFMQCQDEELVVHTSDGRRMNLTENLRPHATLVLVPTTEPGQTVQIAIEFTAPQFPGTFISYWKSVFADGTLCFPQAQGLSVKVRVSTLATAAQEMR